MAGPGGGPPRKSHTKSRKGCKTCKKRHIRCDESYPQCRNCTKHNCRCDYMDSPPPDDVSKPSSGPNLMWTPRIEQEVQTWQRTGAPPGSLNLSSFEHFGGLSTIDLRLVHHLASVHRDMLATGHIDCTFWVKDIPTFLEAATDHDFVMSAILSFSANHLAWMTNAADTKNLAYYYRGVALKGLQSAIGNFSQENADAILAASIFLCWQASEWSSWTSVVQGIQTVVQSMGPWKDQSRFAAYIDDHHHFFFPQPATFSLEDDPSLQQVTNALNQLCSRMPTNQLSSRRLREILGFTQQIRDSSASMQAEQLFEKLQPLREWLYFMPLTWIKEEQELSHSNLLLLAQLYSVALAVDSSIPELRGAALGSLVINALEAIDARLHYEPLHRSMGQQELAEISEIMQHARLMITKARLETTPDPVFVPPRMPGAQSPYGFNRLSLGSAPGSPGTPSYMPGTPSGMPQILAGGYPMMTNTSFEDLSIPPSPFLQHDSPISRPASQLLETAIRPGSMSFGNRPLSAYSFESTAYSTGWPEEEQVFQFGGHSPAYSAGGSAH